MLTVQTLSSLEKVFLDEAPSAAAYAGDVMLLGEQFSFQMAYYLDEWDRRFANVRISGAEGLALEAFHVGHVPCDHPVLPNHDDYVLRGKPGLFPDPLLPLQNPIRLYARQWRTLWFLVDGREAKPGTYAIVVTFESEQGEMLAQKAFRLTVLDVQLPAQKTMYTNWFHVDCIATVHQVAMYSPEHWRLIEAYARTAHRFGMNMILTPIFTLPLDTKVGGERPTHQLAGVEKNGEDYRFDFSLLDRWIGMMQSIGFEYFEMGHLFTQWGAKAAPKIVAKVDGVEKRIFGWDTPATGEAYAGFLRAFLPVLTGHLHALGVAERCFFHLSDEPHLDHLDDYRAAHDLVAPYLKGLPTLDALSNFAFYETGLVQRPVPASNHIEPFHQAGVHPLWTYCCISQHIDVPNRFIDMHSMRQRIQGVLLYRYDLEGFLQWGYNFYFAQYSHYPVNPWLTSSADGFVQNGDAFIVYPGPEGCLPSLRLCVMNESLQDVRALQALEAKWGRERVVAWLEEGLEAPLSMKRYPRDPQWLLRKRAELYEALSQ